jgi:hypothetical protein
VPDHAPVAFRTSHHFHKVFLKSGGYAVEFDTNADPKYDTSGLGRVHREDAPSPICLSLPCPAHPVYTLDLEAPMALSICPGVPEHGAWRFATDPSVAYEVTTLSEAASSAHTAVLCRFSPEKCVEMRCEVSAGGVGLTLNGDGEIACLLPAFSFDGEVSTEIRVDGPCLTVSYNGWICRYTVDGVILDTGKLAANRNGHYRAFLATARDALHVSIEITKA